MKLRNLSHCYKMCGQWYGMPPQCRKSYRYELRCLRKMERQAFKRMVEELVAEELSGDFDYWDAELDKAIAEWR